MIDFGIVQRATQNFAEANKIGQGGFSVVYMGVLEDGRKIAVKKLSEMPNGDETTEFENEVVVIASLQHVNIVRLLGWSVNGVEKVLIYDFLEKGTLCSYLLGEAENSVTLNWQTRFNIINGIVRGMKYLHEESQLKVIHRDIKSANVLLDRDMVPKISDFGMAKIFQRSQNQDITRRMAGTYGYMPPEYVNRVFSIKFDIYSLGVVILEIVRGKTNSRFFSECHINLVSHARLKWEEGFWQEIVDPIILVASPSLELIRCIQVALLCVEDDPVDRPTTSQVVAMLGNLTNEIPQPKTRSNMPYHSPSSSNDESSVGDDYSITRVHSGSTPAN